jgi:hypothetical protein
LVDYSINQLNENQIFKAGLEQLAIGGEFVGYNELNRISDEIDYYHQKEKELSKKILKRPSPPEKYDRLGQEIEYNLEDSPEEERPKTEDYTTTVEPFPEELTFRDCICKIRELRKEYRIECYKTSAKKSIPKNLCYFLLYYPQPIKECKTEDDKFRHRISKLRKCNLLLLIQIMCKINNDYYKTEIENTKKLKIRMKRPIKKYSAVDKEWLVQAGKSYGLKQKEVQAQTGFGRTTVQKYW